jgi:hypothetical protein
MSRCFDCESRPCICDQLEREKHQEHYDAGYDDGYRAGEMATLKIENPKLYRKIKKQSPN